MMLLILQDSVTSAFIGEMEVDFIPEVGATLIFNEGQPEEANYTLVKKLRPTLIRNGQKVVRCRVTLAI